MLFNREIRRCARIVFWLVLVASIGCGRRDGLSDYQRAENERQSVIEKLKGQGVKLKEKGSDVTAYEVDLSGLTITDEMIQQLGQLEYLSELNLSKSTITDEQLGKIHELRLNVRCFKIDLSNTAITDAGLDKIVNVGVLSDLNVARTKITKAGAERLKTRKLNDQRIPEFLRKAPKVHF